MHQLYTIRVSHYNERARFALDLARIPYKEHPNAPMLHMFPVLRAVLQSKKKMKKADRISSPLSTPLFIGTDGCCLQDSGEIVHYANQKLVKETEMDLYPEEHLEEIAQWEKEFHDVLGPYARVVAYYGLSGANSFGPLTYRNVSQLQAVTFMSLSKIILYLVFSRLKVNKENYETGKSKIKSLFDKVSRALETREYITGSTFTAADLTFASLSAIVMWIDHNEGYGAFIPSLNNMPEEFKEYAQELRATKAGQHVQSIYKQYRKKPIHPCEPRLDAEPTSNWLGKVFIGLLLCLFFSVVIFARLI